MSAFSPFRVVMIATLAMLVWSPSALDAAGDYQITLLGNGGDTDPDAICVDDGGNGFESTVVPDDFQDGQRIRAGANGICNSPATGNDVLHILVGNGLANRGVIHTGFDGLCSDATVTGGDDVRLIAIGQGRPFMPAIRVGGNGILDTDTGSLPGDDTLSAVICARSDGLQSTPDPADLSVGNLDTFCLSLCLDNFNCIIPSSDGILQTAVAPGDELVPFISSGPNGIGETTAHPSDTQTIFVGTGFTGSQEGGEICIDSGADGVADTSICGNGIFDIEENTLDVGGTTCDDGNSVGGDGCGSTCVVESGWSCGATPPSLCTPVCGDGDVVGSEPCDDGDNSNNDNCLNSCQNAACGDGFKKTGGTGPVEECDDGCLAGIPNVCEPVDNGDGCDANCTLPNCGNGAVNAGEACDDGDAENGDGCDNNCTVTACGNGITTAPEACDDENALNDDECLNTCALNVCGDTFVLNGTEQCDDANGVNGDGCDNNCTTTACGNDIQTVGEACDDGNAVNSDGCLATCALASCGDGFRKTSGGGPNEQCDDGNPVNGDGCDIDCTTSTCGNGIVGAPETCDDDNSTNGDGCDNNCTITACGNSIRTGVEECDDGNVSNQDNCLNACLDPSCGDGFVKTSGSGLEDCDDANLDNGDDCTNACDDYECGDGNIHTSGTLPFEPCDDGNTQNRDDCLNTCALPICGDNVVHDQGTGPFEPCDDGNTIDTDDCRNVAGTCVAASCGDGFLHSTGTPPFETCEDGNVVSGDGCDANCTPTGCGNGVVTAGETCDDNNLVSGDGCDSNCTPSGCGNGIVAPNETCDDSNVIDGDGCDSNCTDTGCGNGVVTAGEACDDANNQNDDACVVGCLVASCGDGFKQRTVEECDDGCLAGVPNVCEPVIDDADEICSFECQRLRPTRCGNGAMEGQETCDDANNADGDDCTNACQIAACGDSIVHDQESGTEECDDGNGALGDGCTPACVKECGSGVIDYYCSQPTANAGNPCVSDADCDSVPAAGDGLCITGEDCDPGLAGFCDDQISPICSQACLFKACGNGVTECEEECDLGAGNTQPGSGCTPTCTRNLAEGPGPRECPAAFTVDLPPQPLPSQKETCVDGGACDFDQIANGACVFRIGVCLNRDQLGCDNTDGLRTFDLLGVKIRGKCVAGRVGAKCDTEASCDTAPAAGDGDCLLDRAVDATITLTEAVRDLGLGNATIPGRCTKGLKRKVCSVNNECDKAFGLGDGVCDIGTGVEFDPPLDETTQGSTCTDGQDIVVDAGTKLKIRSFIRRSNERPDKDSLMLICNP